ncbi:26S proteasome non-ATPase regulatory subunit 9 [Portunus trituberculatus]|uniref:26S proteasome non-ATPase regulatory subunit 9 n=1 Tax=Portunus trituberculatus TaxID=210409 RepID=A0A5B7GNI0_PORTR|nr:26S proteasome non-ATPase regulatory subunit 9 [Portunus trituberculatus]
MGLVQEKEKVEQTLKELWDVLKSNNVGLSESLIDSEGYPRSDIDVYQVRHARHQIKYKKNPFIFTEEFSKSDTPASQVCFSICNSRI